MWLKNLTGVNFNFALVKKIKCEVFIAGENEMGMIIILHYIREENQIFFNGPEEQGKHIKAWLDSKLNIQEPTEDCW